MNQRPSIPRESDVTIHAKMDTYTLTSKARPRLRGGKETRLYDVMEELGGGPVALDDIVRQCEYRLCRALLKTKPSVRNSVEWHLRNWLKCRIVEKLSVSAK